MPGLQPVSALANGMHWLHYRCVPPLHLAGPAVFISQGQLSQPWKLVSRQAIGLATGHGPCTRVLPEHGKYKHATLFCVPTVCPQSIHKVSPEVRAGATYHVPAVAQALSPFYPQGS